ncbi:MAG TPA: site-specific integrase [Terriglobia bacterium]|nr:site-specific integrase [Terriglobia bacterium]
MSRAPEQFEALAEQVLGSIENTTTRMMYRKAVADFLGWWRRRDGARLDRSLVHSHLRDLQQADYAPATINQRLAAIRKLVTKAADQGLVNSREAMAIARIQGPSARGVRTGNSLTAEQSEDLINAPDPSSVRGKRDRALLALLVGCALRRGELVGLTIEDVQPRDQRWVLLDLKGVHGRHRTVALPIWVKQALDTWLQSSRISEGPIFRAVDRDGKVSDRPISQQTVLQIVVTSGRAVGLDVRPRDLRRTCARLCRAEGGDLEQIQLFLGHSNIQSTERYLGARRHLNEAPNDRVRMKWHKGRDLAS